MKFKINSWFGQPKVTFKISHKVINYLTKQVVEQIFTRKEEINETIHIFITTKKEVTEAYLSKPIFDKKNDVTNYSFWLPYYLIVDSDNQLKSYLDYFFIVLKDFLKLYSIDSKEVDRLKEIVGKEVLNNVDYQFQPPSFEVDVDSILNEMGLDED